MTVSEKLSRFPTMYVFNLTTAHRSGNLQTLTRFPGFAKKNYFTSKYILEVHLYINRI